MNALSHRRRKLVALWQAMICLKKLEAGTTFDSFHRNNAFDTRKRNNAFDVYGIPNAGIQVILACGPNLRRSGQPSDDGILYYNVTAGTWNLCGQKFTDGYGVDLIDGTAYFSARGNIGGTTTYYLCKYERGILTALGKASMSSGSDAQLNRIIRVGSDQLMCVGNIDGFTPTGGSGISTTNGIWWNGSSWASIALGTFGYPAGDAVVHEGTAYAATSQFGCYSWNGVSWSGMNTGLYSGGYGRDAYCIASWGGSLYLGGFLYTTSSTKAYVVRWNGSSWVSTGFGTTYIPYGFATTPNKLIATTGSSGRVYEWDGSSWSYAVGSDAGFYCAQKGNSEEVYYCSSYSGDVINKRESGAWATITGAKYTQGRLSKGLLLT